MTTTTRTNAETVYSKMMGVVFEYDEMVLVLKQVRQAAAAAQSGTTVDWSSVIRMIDNLKALQQVAP